MLRHGAVHGVGKNQIGLAGLQANFQDLLPERPGIDLLDDLIGLGGPQAKEVAVAHGFHKGVGDRDAVMQVERLAIEVAGRFADFQEFFDLGMMDVEIDRRGPAPQRTLADGQGQAVHDPDEGDDAAGLTCALDLFTYGADPAPIGANTAAIRGEGYVLVPDALDTFQAVANGIEEAGDGQTAPGPTIRQDRRCRHEPEVGDVVIDTLGMVGIVGIGRRHPGEHVLIGLTSQKIAVLKGGLAKVGQVGVAATVHLNLAHQLQLGPVGAIGQDMVSPLRTFTHRPKRCFTTAHVPTRTSWLWPFEPPRTVDRYI